MRGHPAAAGRPAPGFSLSHSLTPFLPEAPMDHSVITIAVRPLLSSIGGGDSIVHSPLHPHLRAAGSAGCIAPLSSAARRPSQLSFPWMDLPPRARHGEPGCRLCSWQWRTGDGVTVRPFVVRAPRRSTFPIRAAETSSMTTQQEKRATGEREAGAESTGPSARLAASCAIAGRLSVFLFI